jgi:hypothetical protein
MIRRKPDGSTSAGLLRKIVTFLIRFSLMVVYRERGAQYNRYGSIVSPRELYIQRNQMLGVRARKFRDLLKVQSNSTLTLKRFGPIGDGGYFLPENILKLSSHLISCGIGSNNDFEIALARQGFHGIQIDNSISKAPILHHSLTFLKTTLGRDKNSKSIEDIIEQFPGVKNFVLKLDIEGSEYSVLEDLDMSFFQAIIIEFHFLHLISEDTFWNRIQKILLSLNETHSLLYINPNNYSGFSIIGGVPIPITVEVLYVAKDAIKSQKKGSSELIHPEFLEPNNPKWAQLEISHFFPLWKEISNQ